MMYVKVLLECGEHFFTTANSLNDARKNYIGSKIDYGPLITECISVELATEEEVNASILWCENFPFSDTFWTPYKKYAHKIGSKFTVVRRATIKDVELECLPKWLIKFEDGETIFALPEEIISEYVKLIQRLQ